MINMNTTFKIIISSLLGYFVGNFNPSYLIGRVKGFDIRKKGSHNAGGSNAVIVMGKKIGFFCCLFDIFKAFCVVKFTCWLYPEVKMVFACTSTACILGHMFPIFMHFKGGKGLACLGGVVLAYSPFVFVTFLGVELLLVTFINYICVIPITASVAFPIVYALKTGLYAGALIMCLFTVAIFCKHIENLKRIANGTELRLSFLWNRKAETDRVTGNMK